MFIHIESILVCWADSLMTCCPHITSLTVPFLKVTEAGGGGKEGGRRKVKMNLDDRTY